MTFTHSPRTDPRPGFTLVELLVVIAVVGILAALLLPALAHSKQSAFRAGCLNNLRQLSLATRLYWDDYRGEAFRFRGPTTNGGDIFWFGWLERGAEGERRFDPRQGALWPYLQGRGVEVCPSFNYASSRLKLKATGASYAYGYNLHLSTPSSRPPVKLDALRRPADLALFADAAQVNTFQAPAAPDNPLLEEFYYVNAYEPTAHFRHRDQANVVFVDGHAAAERAVADSIDPALPGAKVGRLRDQILLPSPGP
jgi:prepilin-type N-terminal cleavage/methylation domain-containing protein/prepilin-type processing-associated H-X9-DG protein